MNNSDVTSFAAGLRGAIASASDPRARCPGFDTRSCHILLFLLPLIQETARCPGFDIRSCHILLFILPLIKKGSFSYRRKYVHEVPVNCLRGLSLPRKNVVRTTGHYGMTIAIYHGRTTTTQQQQRPFVTHVMYSAVIYVHPTLSDRPNMTIAV